MSARKALESDKSAIMQIVSRIDMFTPDEIEFMDGMFDAHASGQMEAGHDWIVIEDPGGQVAGTAYFGPEQFVPDVLNIYFIGVLPEAHGQGLGGNLIGHIEAAVAGSMRVILVETSSRDKYKQARGFYAGLGYDQEARIREYYGPGDDKITFWKKL